MGGWHVAVNPNTEHPEATLDAINAMASETFQIGLMELLGLIPPDVTLLEEVTEEEVGPVGRYAETFQSAAETAVPRPVTEIWPEQSTLIAQEVHDAYTDEKTPETAMADLREELEGSEEDANEE